MSLLFNTAQNFLIFVKFYPSQIQSGQTLNLEPNFKGHSKFLDFAKFHPLKVMQKGSNSRFQAKFSTRLKISQKRFWVVKTLNFDQNFKCDWKFLNFTKFPPSHVPSGQKCQFLAKFSMWLKISWFCPISSFAGSEWSKISLWAKFWTLLKISGFYQISSFAGPEWSKLSILSQIFSTTGNFWMLPKFTFPLF